MQNTNFWNNNPLLRLIIPWIIGLFTGYEIRNIAAISALTAIIFTILGVCHLFNKRAKYYTPVPFVMVTGMIYMAVYLHYQQVKLPEQKIMLQGIITTPPEQKGKVVAFDMLLLNSGSPVKVKAAVLRDTVTNNYKLLKLCSCMEFYSRIEPIQSIQLSEHFDYGQWLTKHGYKGQVFINIGNWNFCHPDLSSLSVWQKSMLQLALYRQDLIQRIEHSNLDESIRGMTEAMLLGYKGHLTKTQKEAYSIAGTAHLLALSGLHLGIIYFLLTFLLPKRRWRFFTQTGVLVVIWLYVMFVGASPSVLRAALMITIYSAVAYLGQDRFPVNTLSGAALVMLLFNPLNFWDTGFQLSFLAVLGILLFNSTLYNLIKLPKPLQMLWGTVTISVSAQILTLPVVLYSFGRLSPYSLLSNIVAVPLGSCTLYFMAIAVILWLMPCHFTFPLTIAGIMMQYLNRFVFWVSQLPGANIGNINFSIAQIIIYYVMVAVGCVIVHKLKRYARFRKQLQHYQRS